jgi:hypothetical protein
MAFLGWEDMPETVCALGIKQDVLLSVKSGSRPFLTPKTWCSDHDSGGSMPKSRIDKRLANL